MFGASVTNPSYDSINPTPYFKHSTCLSFFEREGLVGASPSLSA